MTIFYVSLLLYHSFFELLTLIMRNKTNKCIFRYVNLLCYKHRSLLYVSATYRGLLQGSVL